MKNATFKPVRFGLSFTILSTNWFTKLTTQSTMSDEGFGVTSVFILDTFSLVLVLVDNFSIFQYLNDHRKAKIDILDIAMFY